MAKQISAGAFEKSLSDFAAEFRAAIDARVDGFEPDPNARKERLAKALTDDGFGFFARTYFPHYIRDQDTVRPSVFQSWLIEKLPETVTAWEAMAWAIAAPRGEAKSTYMLIFAIWVTVRKLKRYMLYIMDSYEQAAVVVEAFKAEFESNPRLKMDFPKICGAGRVWRDGECVTNNDVKFHARGAGQKIRGLKHGPYRPDGVFLDDIENDENVQTPGQRDKLENWLNKAVENLGEAGAKFDLFYVGTILHYDSVLARTQKNPLWRDVKFQAVIDWPTNMDLWEEWEEILRNDGQDSAQDFYQANEADMLEGTRVSWPDKRPLLSLMKMKIRVGDKAFNSEYQNTPTDDNAAFSEVTFWVQPRSGLVLFGACDPSLGKKGKTGKKGDPSAILVGAFDRSNVALDVLAASIKRRTPIKIINDIIAMQRQFSCVMWFFESVQFQEFLRTQLITEAGRVGINVPAKPIIPNTDKDLRIESLSVPITDGRIRMHASQKVLLEQLQQYPNADHDDGPDALEMLWSGAIKHATVGEFMSSGERTFTGTLGTMVQGGVLGAMGNY